MTLVKTTLKNAIEAAFSQAQDKKDSNPAAARAAVAEALATAIDAYIRSGTVVTTGSATTQTGTIS